jgi:hypothetical protein
MENLLTQQEINHIKEMCNFYNIENYTINTDGSIDVADDVMLSEYDLDTLPLKFNKVSGSFYCNKNNLTSLEGCPKEVGLHFNCMNNSITSLIGCPTIVNGFFMCKSNHLTSLEGCPITIGKSFACAYNALTSLKYAPSIINADFDCNFNSLTSLEHCPGKIMGAFNCSHNELTSLEYAPTEISEEFWCGFNRLPTEFDTARKKLSHSELSIFFKYQFYYDIWNPEFNKDNMIGLIEEIKDGLL